MTTKKISQNTTASPQFLEEKFIKVVGAKEHNLKNVSIQIPKNELVVVTE